jgi:hypothetical protein
MIHLQKQKHKHQCLHDGVVEKDSCFIEILDRCLFLLHLLIERYVHHCIWGPLKPSDSDFGPGTGRFPYSFRMTPRGLSGA